MIAEVVFTSAPRGLTSRTGGWVTVAHTRGMAAPLVEAVASLSAYSPDKNGERSEPSLSHVLLDFGGQRLHVLSRITPVDAAAYGGRVKNHLAHHLVIDAPQAIPGGPAGVLARESNFMDAWEGEPRLLEPLGVGAIGSVVTEPGTCTAWQRATGDAGWAGELAGQSVDNPRRTVFLLHEPGVDVLGLFAEAQALLPSHAAWQATFSTRYRAELPRSPMCQWRAVCATDDGRRLVRSVSGARVLDLSVLGSQKPSSQYADAARRGEVIVVATPAGDGEAQQRSRVRQARIAEAEAKQSGAYGLADEPKRRVSFARPSEASGTDVAADVRSTGISRGLVVMGVAIGMLLALGAGFVLHASLFSDSSMPNEEVAALRAELEQAQSEHEQQLRQERDARARGEREITALREELTQRASVDAETPELEVEVPTPAVETGGPQEPIARGAIVWKRDTAGVLASNSGRLGDATPINLLDADARLPRGWEPAETVYFSIGDDANSRFRLTTEGARLLILPPSFSTERAPPPLAWLELVERGEGWVVDASGPLMESAERRELSLGVDIGNETGLVLSLRVRRSPSVTLRRDDLGWHGVASREQVAGMSIRGTQIDGPWRALSGDEVRVLYEREILDVLETEDRVFSTSLAADPRGRVPRPGADNAIHGDAWIIVHTDSQGGVHARLRVTPREGAPQSRDDVRRLGKIVDSLRRFVPSNVEDEETDEFTMTRSDVHSISRYLDDIDLLLQAYNARLVLEGCEALAAAIPGGRLDVVGREGTRVMILKFDGWGNENE